MVYAYDLWAQLPVKDLYDSQLMLASVLAAKDMYEKGLQEMKDFKKDYGDFISPILEDMDWYNKNVTGRVRDVMNQLYSAGIDPIRSAEGRAVISKLINDIPTGTINQMRQSAETKRLYDAAAIKMGPAYNRSFADWDFARRHDGVTPSQWSTVRNGIFTDSSPVEYATLQELVHPSFSSIKPHMLSQEEVESRGYLYDKNNDYTGIVRGDMERVMGQLMPGVRDDARFMYHRELAKQDLIREGVSDPTEQQIDERLVDNAITSDAQIMTPLEISPNRFALIKAEGDLQIRVAGAKAAIDFHYDRMRGSGNRGDEYAPLIFREAAARLQQQTQQSGPLRSGYGLQSGAYVGYDVFEDPHYQWMDPVGAGIRSVKDNKSGNFAFMIPGSQVSKIYKLDLYDDEGFKITAEGDVRRGKDVYFIPSGQMHAERDADGRIKYYITGTLQGMKPGDVSSQDGWQNTFGGGSQLYEIEVTERAFNYGKKQSGTYSPNN